MKQRHLSALGEFLGCISWVGSIAAQGSTSEIARAPQLYWKPWFHLDHCN